MNVSVIGNYMPRQCGLATFTTDMATWFARELGPNSDVFVVAMNDRPEGYNYPPMVRFEVLANHARDYHRAADFLNLSEIDIICLQHEFGIFGGPMGIYIADLLRDIKKPVVTTVHTVLEDPEPERREALIEVAELSDAIVVMSERSFDILEAEYGIHREKVHLIHHGVPDMPFDDPDLHKERWGLKGKKVLLTFGLLHPGKGIEYMIEALPEIVGRFPDVMYVVLGATHPPLKKREGEKYRFFLKRTARDLGVEDNVVFYDRFLSLEELCEFLAACDIYVTPYLDPRQIVSGTLAYAMGIGRPVVSTPYYYAQELCRDGRGVLVEAEDPAGLEKTLEDLLDDPERLKEMRHKAYTFGRKMIWREVAKDYVRLFRSVLAGRELAPVTTQARKPISIRDLPRPKLDYLLRLTDDNGVIRRSHYDIPDRASGYSTDVNALALQVAVLCHLQIDDPRSVELARTCIGFLRFMQLPDGRFHNFLEYDLHFADDVGGEQCQGRALAGLGLTVALESDEGLASLAKSMFDDAIAGLDITFPRAVAYAIVGSFHYLTRFGGASHVSAFLEKSAEELLEAYERTAAPGWRWFEDELTYGNGNLPRALLLAYRATGDERYREAGRDTLGFLTEVCHRDGFFDLVGDQGWYPRGGERARFKQLPIEAASLVEAYLDAYIVEHEERYIDLARVAFEWFMGRNVAKEQLYNFAQGSCSDGILAHGLDPNRSSEAASKFLLALLRIGTAMHLEPVAGTRAAAV